MGITLNAGNVSAWADQSGQGNNLAQTTTSRQPTHGLVTAGGLPLLGFNPSAPSGLLCATSTGLSAPAFTALAVYRPTQVAAGDKTIANIGATAGGRQYRVSGNKQNLTRAIQANAATGATSLNSDTNYVGAVRYDGTSTVTFTLNGAADGTVAAGAHAFSNGAISIGVNGAGTSEGFVGYIGEVIAYSRALTDAELAGVTNYLGGRFGVTVP